MAISNVTANVAAQDLAAIMRGPREQQLTSLHAFVVEHLTAPGALTSADATQSHASAARTALVHITSNDIGSFPDAARIDAWNAIDLLDARVIGSTSRRSDVRDEMRRIAHQVSGMRTTPEPGVPVRVVGDLASMTPAEREQALTTAVADSADANVVARDIVATTNRPLDEWTSVLDEQAPIEAGDLTDPTTIEAGLAVLGDADRARADVLLRARLGMSPQVGPVPTRSVTTAAASTSTFTPIAVPVDAEAAARTEALRRKLGML